MSDRPIATVSGTMLVPGVSRNMRLYTKEVIAKAVSRMQARIADPNGLPIVMRTHHEAGDNSASIVGRVHAVSLAEDGSARYSALIYDTQAGRDIAALITPKQPALRSVSIHGYWLGPPKKVKYEGESVTTGDDLEINAVDWTATPGVVNAVVHDAAWLTGRHAESTESEMARTPISEAVEATITTITEAADDGDEATWNALVEATYTQKQKDQMVGSGAMRNAQGNGSYPIKSKSDLRKAIRAVGRGGANHNAIRRHIIARAKALGLSAMIPSNWNSDGSMKESQTRFGAVTEYMGDFADGASSFCIDACNGPISITLRGCGIDPAELRVIAAAAMDAACDALSALDPDMDGDIDLDGAPHADTDGDSGGESFASGGVITPQQARADLGVGESVPATLAPGEHIVSWNEIPTYNTTAATGAAAVATTVTYPTTTVESGQPFEQDPVSDNVTINVTVPGPNVTEAELRNTIRETVSAYRERTGNPAPTDTDVPVENGETVRTHEEVPAVSEATSTTQAAETTATPTQPERTLTDADIAALGTVFSAALKEHAASVPAAPAAETSTTQAPLSGTTAEQVATTAAETTKADGAVTEKALQERAALIEAELKTKLEADFAARETAMREAVIAQVREEMLRTNGTPRRTGYRVHENEQQLPDVQSLWEDRTSVLLGDFAKTPVPQPGTGFAPAPTPTQPEVPQTAVQ